MVYIIQNTEALSLQKAPRRIKSPTSQPASVELVDQAVSCEQEQRPRRRMSFEEAKEATFSEFSETFQRLADVG